MSAFNYAVVEFTEDKTVDIVPSNWIEMDRDVSNLSNFYDVSNNFGWGTKLNTRLVRSSLLTIRVFMIIHRLIIREHF